MRPSTHRHAIDAQHYAPRHWPGDKPLLGLAAAPIIYAELERAPNAIADTQRLIRHARHLTQSTTSVIQRIGKAKPLRHPPPRPEKGYPLRQIRLTQHGRASCRAKVCTY